PAPQLTAYPGVGSLTRALLEHPPSVVKRVIAIEDSPGLLPFLEPLAAADPRLHIIRANPFRWETYSDLMASPLMADVARHPWEEVHPGLQLMCRMPLTIGSEQLMSQFLRFAPNRAWLFQYGRLPMGFLLPYSLWDRLSAKPLDPTRCKLTVMTEATCHTRLSLPLATLQPYAAHFHPSPSQQDLRRAQTAVHISDITARNKGKQLGHPYVSASFTPRTEQVVRRAGLDHWDYVTRMMFVSRAQPVSEAIDRLGLGGKSLLKQLKFDTSKLVKELEVHEWTQVVDAFVDWPFAPSVYMIQGMLEDVDAVRSSKA
ncbi:S-adenosyl-L-methionine-dependent methyltransferase, partial [Calocera viscosa TUFC12733]